MLLQNVEPEELKAQTERKGHRRKSVAVVFGTSSGARAQPHLDPGLQGPAVVTPKGRRGAAGWEFLTPKDP